MLAWLFLIVLVAGEVAGLTWYLRKEYMRVMFSEWSALIYTSALTADLIAARLVSLLVTPGGSPFLLVLCIFGIIAIVIIAVMMLFLRWVVSHDMSDVP